MNNNGESGQGNVSDQKNNIDNGVKIWSKPSGNRRKKYYEVTTNEPEENSSNKDNYDKKEDAVSETGSETGSEKSEYSNSSDENHKKDSLSEMADIEEAVKRDIKHSEEIKADNSNAEETVKEVKDNGEVKKKKLKKEKIKKEKIKKEKTNKLSFFKNRNKEKQVKKEQKKVKKKNMLPVSGGNKNILLVEPDPKLPLGERIKERWKKSRKVVLALLVIGIILGASSFYNKIREYHSSEVEWQVSANNMPYSNYVNINNKIIHYSQDGVSCIDLKGEVLWNKTFNMDVPQITVTDDYFVVYDVKGKSFYICTVDGCKGSVTTEKSIIKADITASGVVAVVLDNNKSNYINYYDKDGSRIDVEIKTLISGDGYPLDIAVSPDGTELMTSYMYADSGSMLNQVVFRNFEVGKNNADRTVGGFRQYGSKVIAQVEFFDNQNSVAITEDSLDFYSTRNALKPELSKSVSIDSKMRSVFTNQEYVGVVLESEEEKSPEKIKNISDDTKESEQSKDSSKSEINYKMLVFDKNGKQVSESDIEFEYNYIDFSGDGIIVYNNSEFAVYNIDGVCKFSTRIKGNLNSVMRISENNIIIHSNNALQSLRLK